MGLDARALAELLPDLPGWRAGRILDVRSAAAFAAGHLRGAVSIPLGDPAGRDGASLAEKLPSIFLPPHHVPLLVVADTADAAARVADELRARGRAAVDGIGADRDLIAALPPDLRAQGRSYGRLWEPPGWLAAHESDLPPPTLGPALDLGCGSGRACVWLAERGYRVTGIDHEPAALALAERLAASRGLGCRFVASDLRRPEAVADGGWGLIVNVRFLHRPLLARLGDLLVPGGVACVRTFRDAPGYHGHPRPRHRLARGELLAACPRGRFTILAHQEDHDAQGRPAAGIVARRLAD